LQTKTTPAIRIKFKIWWGGIEIIPIKGVRGKKYNSHPKSMEQKEARGEGFLLGLFGKSGGPVEKGKILEYR